MVFNCPNAATQQTRRGRQGADKQKIKAFVKISKKL